MKQQPYHKRFVGTHKLGPDTLMMSYGYDPKLSEGAVKTPLFMSSTFAFRTAEDGAHFFDVTSGRVKLNAEETSGLVYSRFNNPNLEVLEDRISVLEEADDACVFSSGMSAITTAAMAFLRPGMSMVMSKPIYGGTSSLFTNFFPDLGITVVPMTDGLSVDGITSAMNEAARHGQLGMVLIETPANPTNTMIDIGLVGGQCLQHGLRSGHKPILVVDNTFLGPIYQKPILHGADLVVYSVTKYLAGHSDLVAGAVAGRSDLMATVLKLRGLLGTQLDPHSCWLISRSLETLSLRMERANKSARTIAEYLRDHPQVEDVNYLGFLKPGTREAEVFAKQCSSAGSTFAFTIKGGREAAFRFLNRIQIIKLAVSLGGTESLICHPASTTHSGVKAAERAALGITEGTIRLSIGVEDPSDLLADIEQAMQA
jgi:methionine-gamma-lyase